MRYVQLLMVSDNHTDRAYEKMQGQLTRFLQAHPMAIFSPPALTAYGAWIVIAVLATWDAP